MTEVQRSMAAVLRQTTLMYASVLSLLHCSLVSEVHSLFCTFLATHGLDMEAKLYDADGTGDNGLRNQIIIIVCISTFNL